MLVIQTPVKAAPPIISQLIPFNAEIKVIDDVDDGACNCGPACCKAIDLKNINYYFVIFIVYPCIIPMSSTALYLH